MLITQNLVLGSTSLTNFGVYLSNGAQIFEIM